MNNTIVDHDLNIMTMYAGQSDGESRQDKTSVYFSVAAKKLD